MWWTNFYQSVLLLPRNIELDITRCVARIVKENDKRNQTCESNWKGFSTNLTYSFPIPPSQTRNEKLSSILRMCQWLQNFSSTKLEFNEFLGFLFDWKQSLESLQNHSYIKIFFSDSSVINTRLMTCSQNSNECCF